MGIAKIATAGYNPTGNATVERFHRYLGAALCIVYERKAANWDDYIAPVLFSYRASKNDATGFQPLHDGKRPRSYFASERAFSGSD